MKRNKGSKRIKKNDYVRTQTGHEGWVMNFAPPPTTHPRGDETYGPLHAYVRGPHGQENFDPRELTLIRRPKDEEPRHDGGAAEER